MNDCHRENLRKLQVEIAEDLEPKDILNTLFEDGILSENDCEIISESNSRKDRCQVLLSILPTRGPKAYGSFQKSLNTNSYTHLGTKLDQPERIEKSKIRAEKQNHPCENCSPFIPESLSDSSFVSDLLNRHCCLVFNSIEPIDLLNVLYKEYLLTADDFERVRSGVSRRDRCKLLFTALNKNTSETAFNVFKQSLVKKYQFVNEKLDEDGDSEKKICQSKPELGHGTVSNPFNQTLTKGLGIGKDGSSCSFDFDITPNASLLSNTRCHIVTFSSICDLKKKDKKNQNSRQKTGRVTRDVVPVNPAALTSHGLQKKKIHVTFNFLSNLINEGSYDEFENMTSQLRLKFPNNHDMCCMLSYLQASRCMFQTDTKTARLHINTALSIVNKTSNPKYFTVELITANTRRYLAEKKYGKLQDALDSVKMIIESDPLGCTGRAAGWMYLNAAKQMTSQIALLNFDRPKSIEIYRKRFKSAKISIELALSHFQQDGGNDGPFGFGYGLCRLALLHLRCGDYGQTMGTLYPSTEDIGLAKNCLDQIGNLNISIPKILDAHFLLAKCDYQFRIKNITRALQHAKSAYALSQEINMMEFDFAKQVSNRITFLKQKQPLEIEEISDGKILFDFLDSVEKLTEESDSY